MTAPQSAREEAEFAEEEASLWRITFGPLVWALHFVASYAATAVTCAKGMGAGLDVLRWGIAALTLVALGLIAWLARAAWRQWMTGNPDWYDEAEGLDRDRHHFLGHAALLLAGTSFIGVAFTAMPALLSASCR